MRTLVLSVVLLSLISFSLYASARPNSGGLANRVTELEEQVEELAAALQEAQEILQFVRVETETISGLRGPHFIIEGANVHVQNGSRGQGGTWGEAFTGLGNLLVGYNDRLPCRSCPPEKRTGTHNLVVGSFHSYTGNRGFVAGSRNKITGLSASVCGGKNNEARGSYASVSGGHGNLASGGAASVSGGDYRVAPDDLNWAAGELFEEN
jgi:hypothetical protein